jgi:cytochrome c oxidase subunit I+III
MPRRVYTYNPETGWAGMNLLATIGAGVLGLGVLTFVVNALVSLKRGAIADANPWGGGTLEWATTSPPQNYNFLHLPVVSGLQPLWEEREMPVVIGLRSDRRETLITRTLDAEPDHRYQIVGVTAWPFLAAMTTGTMFVFLMFTPWALPIGMVGVVVASVGWFWPRSEVKEGEEPAYERS